jgi:hypothetical protein
VALEGCQQLHGVLMGDEHGGVMHGLRLAARELRALETKALAAPSSAEERADEGDARSSTAAAALISDALEKLLEAVELVDDADNSLEQYVELMQPLQVTANGRSR